MSTLLLKTGAGDEGYQIREENNNSIVLNRSSASIPTTTTDRSLGSPRRKRMKKGNSQGTPVRTKEIGPGKLRRPITPPLTRALELALGEVSSLSTSIGKRTRKRDRRRREREISTGERDGKTQKQPGGAESQVPIEKETKNGRGRSAEEHTKGVEGTKGKSSSEMRAGSDTSRQCEQPPVLIEFENGEIDEISQGRGLCQQPERPGHEATKLATIKDSEKSAIEPQWEEFVVDDKRVRYEIDVDDEAPVPASKRRSRNGPHRERSDNFSTRASIH
jgi:hypothetical protein